MNDALEIIDKLIRFSDDREKISQELTKIDWDYDGEPVVLTKSIVEAVLGRYAIGELNSDDIEWWANAIEGREHVRFEEENTGKIESAVFSLANPVLEGFDNYEKLVSTVKNELKK